MSDAQNIAQRREPFTVASLERTEIGIEWWNGKPQARLMSKRGAWFTIPIEEIADVAAALSKAVDLIVERERSVRK